MPSTVVTRGDSAACRLEVGDLGGGAAKDSNIP